MSPDRFRLTRRTFGGLVVGGSLALSGCLTGDDSDDSDDPGDDMGADDAGDDAGDDPGDDAGDDTGDNGDDEDAVEVEDQPDDAAAMFVTPEDGDTVESPVQVEAEVEGIELAEAGEAVVGEGHLHVLVDHEGFETGDTIPGPSDEHEGDGIYHWGDGSSEGEIDLDPGEYDLTLQIADGPHRAFGDPDHISITVE